MTNNEVLCNLTNFDMWDIKHYSMCEEEAEVCIKALEGNSCDHCKHKGNVHPCVNCARMCGDYFEREVEN